MNVLERHGAVKDGDAEHQFLLSYLNSSAWEERLVEARAKRQAILDGLAPDTTRPKPRSPGGRPLPCPPASGPGKDARKVVMADASISRPLRGLPKTGAPRRWPFAELAVGLAVLTVLASAPGLWRGSDVTDTAVTTPQDDPPIAAMSDRATRTRTGDLSRTDAATRPQPATGASLGGIEALAASLEEMAVTNSITVVTSQRQAEALDSLDRAQPAASVRVTPFALDRSTVSFYHADDAGAAERMAMQLDGETMDLTGLLPTPPAGTLSVYLAGN